jgi:hypothetical protein
MANYAVWPLAHALNFYYVPTEQRILYNNFIAVRSSNHCRLLVVRAALQTDVSCYVVYLCSVSGPRNLVCFGCQRHRNRPQGRTHWGNLMEKFVEHFFETRCIQKKCSGACV